MSWRAVLKDPTVLIPGACSAIWGAWAIFLKDVEFWKSHPNYFTVAAFLVFISVAINPFAAGWGRVRDQERIKFVQDQITNAERDRETWRRKVLYFVILLESVRLMMRKKCEKYLHAVEDGEDDPKKTRDLLHKEDSLNASLKESIEYLFEFLKRQWREGSEKLTLAFFVPNAQGTQLLPKAVADLDRTSEDKWIQDWNKRHLEKDGKSFASFLWREAMNGNYEPIFLSDTGQAEREGKWISFTAMQRASAVGYVVVDNRLKGQGDFLGIVVATIERLRAFEGREEEMRSLLEVLSTDILFETRKEQYRRVAWREDT